MADTVVADVGLSKQIDVDTELIIASLIALSCIMFTYSFVRQCRISVSYARSSE